MRQLFNRLVTRPRKRKCHCPNCNCVELEVAWQDGRGDYLDKLQQLKRDFLLSVSRNVFDDIEYMMSLGVEFTPAFPPHEGMSKLAEEWWDKRIKKEYENYQPPIKATCSRCGLVGRLNYEVVMLNGTHQCRDKGACFERIGEKGVSL